MEELGRACPCRNCISAAAPTFLSDEELTGLMGDLRRAFRSSPMPRSPSRWIRTATPERLGLLRTLGFNRLSFGVQDFDPRVRVAVHRVQSFEEVRALVQSARALGYASVNVDLIYGLPLQTTESFACTISQGDRAAADRIALYAYAHLPERFKPQRRINEADLPDRATRVGLLSAAIEGFLKHGYAYIGMDHFALHSDSLAQAKQRGELHRNFRATARSRTATWWRWACRPSAASAIPTARTSRRWTRTTRRSNPGASRPSGPGLSPDDLVRREIIMDIMCQGDVDFAQVEADTACASATTSAANCPSWRIWPNWAWSTCAPAACG